MMTLEQVRFELIYETAGKHNPAIDYAIKELNYRIPKQPHYQVKRGLACQHCDNLLATFEEAPAVSDELEYCPKCGQVINWNVEVSDGDR